MRRFERSLILLLPLVSLGCGDASPLRWLITFDSDADKMATVVITAEVREGGCASSTLAYTDTYSLTLGNDTPATAPELGAG